MRLSLLLLVLAAACEPATTTDPDSGGGSMADNDGDGFVGDADCDETDGTVHDGAAELCDGVDNDCDGSVDEEATDAAVFYLDADADGFGDDGQDTTACDLPAGYAAVGGDCDDSDAAYNPDAAESDCTDSHDYNCDGSVAFEDADSDGYAACQDCNDADALVNPGAVELCNNLDDDCDSDVDEDAVDAATWYVDTDGDGYGADTTVVACAQPADAAEYGGDCDDADADYHPGAPETDCTDPNDYNCDGSVGYDDRDGDGYPACEECDDADAAHFPGAVEYCDGADDNCDGQIDESAAVDALTWYSDADGDTYGSASTSAVACSAPSGFVADATDCDDSDPSEFPGAVERCDGDDDNCDGVADEATAVDATRWYMDADTDGYGDAATSQVACDQPAGYLDNADDCDDTDLSEYPGAAEVCDGDDDDCDGTIDEAGAVDADTWYADADGDTYGDPAVTLAACDQPAGYVADAQDCDDASASVSPADTETCNGIDDNCDGTIDESDATDASLWHADSDGDGYGDPLVFVMACGAPAGFVADATDCDDANGAAHPGATESCDGFDDDCDGVVDEDASVDVVTWFRDADGDGYGDATLSDVDCDQPAGFVADATDCNDAAIAVNPGAVEVCDAANVDENCSGAADDADASATGKTTWYADADNDTYGAAASTRSACDQPLHYVAVSGDCDDTSALSNPGETEVPGDGVDEDCSGGETCYVDADDDGYRPTAATTRASADADCADAGEGTSTDPATDCDDATASTHPGATEYCNGADDDCDGATDEDASADVATWFHDGDGDGYGDASLSDVDCTRPSGYVADSTDCNDAAVGVHPGATEVCDGANVDEDCSGAADDADGSASGKSTWYADVDGDGYGDASRSLLRCDAPAGYTLNGFDCDDTDLDVNPGEVEVCDAANVDEDCSGAADDADTEATGQTSWYDDGDSDGYGDASTGTSACDAPSGAVADDTDCDDTRSAVHPGATEVLADGRDENCDGTETCYDDDDNDGFLDSSGDTRVSADGDCADAHEALSTALTTDCDDTTGSVHPGATETCNGVDDNCDGATDEGVTSGYYADLDGDGWGDAGAPASGCTTPAGYVSNSDDCNDGDVAINPDAAEVCDGAGVDEDCNGVSNDSDPGVIDQSSWYADMDGDGYGDPAVGESSCFAAVGYLADATDCDDTAISVYPGAPETIGDAVDQSCDGRETCYADADGDGYRDLAGTTVASVDVDCSDSGEESASAPATDCDDAAATSYPGAPELCNSVDDDCDGVIDDGAASLWYADADGDGYGDASTTTLACAAGSGYVSDSTDCDDSDTAVNPGATEICDNHTDDDCSGEAVDCEYSGKVSVTTADQTINGTVTTDYVGTATAMGDFNGDGYGDLVVGSNGYDTSTALQNMGRAYVFWGPLSGTETPATADVIFVGGKSSGDNMADVLANAGDVDGDGKDDLLIGAHLVNDVATDSGAAYLVKGSASWSSKSLSPTTGASTAFISPGTVASDAAYVGFAIAGAGDVNGDDKADILVGANQYDYVSGATTLANAGIAGLWYGGTTGSSERMTAADVIFLGTAANQGVGYTVSSAGDVDADGFADILIASAQDDTTATNAGAAWLLYGPPSATSYTPTTMDAAMYGPAASDGFGAAAAPLGDVNGDGTDDFAIGSDKGDTTTADVGYLLIFEHAPSGTVALSTADVAIAGVVASDYAGHDVATAGDVNGDGFADVLFGVWGYDETAAGNNGGFGLAYGPVATGYYSVADCFWYGAAADGYSSSSNVNVSLAGAADLDADGFDDFVYGSSESDPAGVNRAGSAWVFYGGGE